MSHDRLSVCLVIGALLLTANSYAAQYTGFSEGTFDNPRAACVGTITCQGLGTSSITWGTAASDTGSSGVIFNPLPFDVDAGVRFKFGTVTLLNRPIVADSAPDHFDLTINLVITNQNATSTRVLDMLQVSTPNTGDPIADSDWISFYPDLAEKSFFVEEDLSETVELWTSFVPAMNDAVGLKALAVQLQPAIGPVSFGAVLGPNGFVGDNPIPEASTGLLTSGSLVLLALGSRLRSRRRQR